MLEINFEIYVNLFLSMALQRGYSICRISIWIHSESWFRFTN